MGDSVAVEVPVVVGEAHLPVPSMSTHGVGVEEGQWVPLVPQGVVVEVGVSQCPGSQVGVGVAVSQLPPTAGLQMGVAVAVSQGVWWQSGVAVGVSHTTPAGQVGVGVLLLPSGTSQPLPGTAATLVSEPVIPATAATVVSIAPSISRASRITWTSLLALP